MDTEAQASETRLVICLYPIRLLSSNENLIDSAIRERCDRPSLRGGEQGKRQTAYHAESEGSDTVYPENFQSSSQVSRRDWMTVH